MFHRMFTASLSSPFERQPDSFMSHGFRKMGLSAIILTLEELTWDPATARSGPEREEMLHAKRDAPAWFDSEAFEAFFMMAQLPCSLKTMRKRCLSEPQVVRDELMSIRQAMDDERASAKAREAELRTNGLPSNWIFSGVTQMLQETLEMARSTVGTGAAAPQGMLFDEIATPRARTGTGLCAANPSAIGWAPDGGGLCT
jgi:hypothetical protein